MSDGEALDKINLKYEVSLSKKNDDEGTMTKTCYYLFRCLRLILKFHQFQFGIGHALWSHRVE